MKFREIIKIANRNLLRSKLRTFLTTAAIFIGALTLVMTNAIGDGARDFADKQVKNIEAANILSVRKKPVIKETEKPDTAPEYKEQTADPAQIDADPRSLRLTELQIETAVKDIPEIKKITPRYFLKGEFITLDGAKKYALELGMLSDGFVQKTEAGRSIDDANQIIIPILLAKTLSQNISSLIGKTATIAYKLPSGEMRTMNLQIVGVATKGIMENYNSFVDGETAQKIYEEQNAGNADANKFPSFSLLLDDNIGGRMLEEIKTKLDARGLIAETLADQRKSREDAISILQIGLNFFAFVALLAASFGIINTLVIAVMERTKEMGLQKAVGMGRRTIFALFSVESVLIGFWGAAAGIVAGIFIGNVTNLILSYRYPEAFESFSLFYFRPLSIILIMLLICTIAFLAGVFPALRASRLNPIDALRYE